MSTAWLYATVSSPRQEETLADQERWARQLCDANSWYLDRIFSKTATGKHGVRKLLALLITELQSTPKELRPSRVLMLRLDRFGRGSIVDSQVAFREIRELGVVVHTRENGDERVEGPMGELIAAAKFALAAQENAVRREKSLAFHARKKAAGEFGSGPPFGFILMDKRLAPYEPEADVVRALFGKRIAGWGYQRIAQLAASIAPPKMRPDGSRRKFAWSTSTITSMLKNANYRGTIVSEAVWDAVAALRGRVLDRRAPRWNWPLRGALRCTCGAVLVGEASGREGHRTRYYVCRRFNEHAGRYPHHNAAKMEAHFVALLEQLRAAPDLTAPLRSKGADIELLRRRRAEIACDREEIAGRRSRAWELAEDGTIARGDLAARLEELTAESDRISAAALGLERELASAERIADQRATSAELLAGAIDVWSVTTTEGQRGIATAVVAYVGGLWADPSRPHRLFRSTEIPDDDSGCKVETVPPETSSLRLGAALAAARAIAATFGAPGPAGRS